MTKNSKTLKTRSFPILVIGGSGFVGSFFLQLSKLHRPALHFVSPTHDELDITKKEDVYQYVFRLRPSFVINFAAITNMDESEKEKNIKKGKTWIINYIGARNVKEACKTYHAFLIHISTDAVFPGSDDYPGPYKESDKPPTHPKGLNWYGFTKRKAEEEILKMQRGYAIIRISHPFGNPRSGKDLVRKTMRDIKAGHPIFSDQFFTPTFLDDLSITIWKILSLKKAGIFHVGCSGLVSRIEFARHIAQKMNIKNTLMTVSLQEFIATGHRAPRARLGGFVTSQTQKKLGVKFHTWQKAVDKTLRRI